MEYMLIIANTLDWDETVMLCTSSKANYYDYIIRKGPSGYSVKQWYGEGIQYKFSVIRAIASTVCFVIWIWSYSSNVNYNLLDKTVCNVVQTHKQLFNGNGQLFPHYTSINIHVAHSMWSSNVGCTSSAVIWLACQAWSPRPAVVQF